MGFKSRLEQRRVVSAFDEEVCLFYREARDFWRTIREYKEKVKIPFLENNGVAGIIIEFDELSLNLWAFEDGILIKRRESSSCFIHKGLYFEDLETKKKMLKVIKALFRIESEKILTRLNPDKILALKSFEEKYADILAT